LTFPVLEIAKTLAVFIFRALYSLSQILGYRFGEFWIEVVFCLMM